MWVEQLLISMVPLPPVGGIPDVLIGRTRGTIVITLGGGTWLQTSRPHWVPPTAACRPPRRSLSACPFCLVDCRPGEPSELRHACCLVSPACSRERHAYQ